MTTPFHEEQLFDSASRHAMVFAHQDDEIMYGGLIRRLPVNTRFLWMTNGDGLAPEVGMDPKAYAELRKAETDEVLKTLERSLEARRCLDFSEIAIYDHFVLLDTDPSRRPEVVAYMKAIGDEIYRELKTFKPDVVWTNAFQNGHPEHDLVHILTAYARRQIEREEKRVIRFFHLPQYEYTILIPHRFHPLYKGEIHEIRLTDEELGYKRRTIECYPSQVKLFRAFERTINGLGKAAWLTGKGFTAETFLRRETFGPMAADYDYTHSTHWFEWANYMRDYHKGVKVRFDTQLAVIAAELKDAVFA